MDSPALQLLDRLTQPWAGSIEFVEESDETLAEVIRDGHTDRVRYASSDRVPTAVRQAASSANIYVADAPVLMCGRVELLWYVQEQSVCVDYHRYGNLGTRSGQSRSEPL